MVCIIAALLLTGALISAANSSGKTVQSGIIGTVFAPCHYVSQKIANGIDKIAGNVKGDEAYEQEIQRLQTLFLWVLFHREQTSLRNSGRTHLNSVYRQNSLNSTKRHLNWEKRLQIKT